MKHHPFTHGQQYRLPNRSIVEVAIEQGEDTIMLIPTHDLVYVSQYVVHPDGAISAWNYDGERFARADAPFKVSNLVLMQVREEMIP